MKGVLLAGGNGTRLSPLTDVVCKQLLPVFDKPMIYYPISTLIYAGVDQLLIICKKDDHISFKKLLGVGDQFGISIQYKIQDAPKGLAHGLLLAADFVGADNFWFILGDNLFDGPDFGIKLNDSYLPKNGSKIFVYSVSDPENYGVANFHRSGYLESLEEKPLKAKSKWAIPGVYFFDKSAFGRASTIKPSSRGEIEMIDLLKSYLCENSLFVEKIKRGNIWFDLGSPSSLLKGANYVKKIQARKGELIGSPEFVANKMNIDVQKRYNTLNKNKTSYYYSALNRLFNVSD